MTDTQPALYPLRLTPALHVKVWGGRRLQSELDKSLPGDAPYGESWELHDTCTVSNGPLAGVTLADVLQRYGRDLIGAQHDPAHGLPLLVKFLDATQWLSVQVHPDDAQARELENDPRGKTEAWVVLATEGDARLINGVKPGTDRQTMADAIRNGTLEDLLVFTAVQPGDVLYMRANTVHALGPGLLIYEIQQSSNVTYRLYDWGRVGLDGRPRELHIDKGVRVSNVETVTPVTHPEGEMLVAGDYFQTARYHLTSADDRHLTTDGAFHVLTCIEGLITIMAADRTVDLVKGQTAMIPAAVPEYTLTGMGTVLNSYPIS